MRSPRRQTKDAAIDLGQTSPERVLELLEPHRRLTSPGPIFVRGGSTGPLTVRLPGSGLSTPPKLTGQVTQDATSVRLVGVIQEARAGVALPYGFATLAVLMALLGLALAPTGGLLPALLICLPAAVAFGVSANSLFRQRQSSFEVDAAQLEAEIRHVVV